MRRTPTTAVGLYQRYRQRGEPVPPDVRAEYNRYHRELGKRRANDPEIRERRNTKQRERYATDPEYRKKVKELSKHSHPRQKDSEAREHYNKVVRKRPSYHFSAYKSDAKHRSLSRNIDLEQFTRLVHDDCVYCGKSATSEVPNGIDRIDNDLGYEVENVQSCCRICNTMKSNLPEKGFFSHVRAVYFFQTTKKTCERYIPFECSGKRLPGTVLCYYKRNARNRSYEFTLTKNEAFDLFFSPCFYCGHFKEGALNGIDRRNNELGYTKSNSVPCCFLCNRMKNVMVADQFVDHVGEQTSKHNN